MNEVLDFERAAARIARNMVWIAALGVPSAWAARGWRWAAGFLLGAAISWVNYRWLKRMVEGLGGTRSPGGFRLAVRYFLLAGGSYVILRYSSISVLAVLAGLFVLIVAVFVEAAFEIFYAGKRTLDHQDL
jgi:hypothetical protein